jgi:SAM-dependent methyltransferase
LWAVLEHVYHPKEMLREINRILKPNGRVVLLVPNIKSIPGRFMRHDDVPRHTTMFSKRTITAMLKLNGFQVNHIHFGNDIFSGSTRGLLNYIVKILASEKMDNIVAQSRGLNRWDEFSCQLCGKDSRIMRHIDKADIAISPFIDSIMDRLGLGFTMTVEATKE